MKGVVYTETVVHSAPEAFQADVPYQLVIVTLANGTRVTGRTVGERLAVDDEVILKDERNGVPFFSKQ